MYWYETKKWPVGTMNTTRVMKIAASLVIIGAMFFLSAMISDRWLP